MARRKAMNDAEMKAHWDSIGQVLKNAQLTVATQSAVDFYRAMDVLNLQANMLRDHYAAISLKGKK